MSEQRQDSPLQSERGNTTIDEKVVLKIAGTTAGEVEGVHMGSSVSRTAGGIFRRATGGFGDQSGDPTRGVSTEVGRLEAAIDLKIAIEYGQGILQTAERVRRNVTERVEGLTGLRVTELNIEVNDILFPEEEKGRERERRHRGEQGSEVDDETEPLVWRGGGLETGRRGRKVGEVEVRDRTHTESRSGSIPEEEVRVEGVPVEEEETAELKPGEGQDGVEKRPRAESERRAQAHASREGGGAEKDADESGEDGIERRHGRRPGGNRGERS
jgi:uncharacterized alkaline shock family protein YloU